MYFAVGVGVAVVVVAAAAAALGVAVVVDVDAAGVVGLTMFASVAAVCRGRLLHVFWTHVSCCQCFFVRDQVNVILDFGQLLLPMRVLSIVLCKSKTLRFCTVSGCRCCRSGGVLRKGLLVPFMSDRNQTLILQS